METGLERISILHDVLLEQFAEDAQRGEMQAAFLLRLNVVRR